MKSISQLTNFYYNDLYPTLQELEDERKALKKRINTITLIYLLAVGIIFWFVYQHTELDTFFAFLPLPLIIYFKLYRYLTKDYYVDFKNKIIAPLIDAIDSNLHYSPTSHISIENFKGSKLFLEYPDRCRGNDYVKGKIDGVNIEFSDIYAEKKRRSLKGEEIWETIFQGLFIISEFPKEFHAQTIVLPDRAQKLFGNLIGGWLQKNNVSRNDLVKMDNPEFEKEFVVYSTDQIEARYILTPALMQKLLNYKRKTKHPLYISFIEGKIYIAIEHNKDMFETSIFHSLLEYKIAKEYIETLHLAVGIVEELKLNQKLWSKL